MRGSDGKITLDATWVQIAISLREPSLDCAVRANALRTFTAVMAISKQLELCWAKLADTFLMELGLSAWFKDHRQRLKVLSLYDSNQS